MRAVIQRVSRASVSIKNKVKSEIGQGLLVLVGIEETDNETDIEWLCNKIVQLRIFNDSNEVMNLSVLETGGSILAISQFTLHAKTRKGNRPSYIKQHVRKLQFRYITILSAGFPCCLGRRQDRRIWCNDAD